MSTGRGQRRLADGGARPLQRRKQVLQGMADGLTAREVARRLGISRRTVEGHLRALREMTGTRSMGELCAVGVAEGWVTPGRRLPGRTAGDPGPRVGAGAPSAGPDGAGAPSAGPDGAGTASAGRDGAGERPRGGRGSGVRRAIMSRNQPVSGRFDRDGLKPAGEPGGRRARARPRSPAGTAAQGAADRDDTGARCGGQAVAADAFDDRHCPQAGSQPRDAVRAPGRDRGGRGGRGGSAGHRKAQAGPGRPA